MTIKERISSELKLISEDADAGKLEAFFCVRIERDHRGESVPTVTVIAEDAATAEQVDAFTQHLFEIGDLLKQVQRQAVSREEKTDERTSSCQN